MKARLKECNVNPATTETVLQTAATTASAAHVRSTQLGSSPLTVVAAWGTEPFTMCSVHLSSFAKHLLVLERNWCANSPNTKHYKTLLLFLLERKRIPQMSGMVAAAAFLLGLCSFLCKLDQFKHKHKLQLEHLRL